MIDYEVGMLVRHTMEPHLGHGKIIQVYGSTIEVDFEHGGVKQFLNSEIAPLEIVIRKYNLYQRGNEDNTTKIRPKENRNYVESVNSLIYETAPETAIENPDFEDEDENEETIDDFDSYYVRSESSDDSDKAKLMKMYFPPKKLFSLNELRETQNNKNSEPILPPAEAGVYAWFFDEIPPNVPTAECIKYNLGWFRPFSTTWYLLYIGLAKKTKLKNRICAMHFEGNAESSVLRASLGCLLFQKLNLSLWKIPTRKSGKFTYTFSNKGEENLSKWMEEHARVAWYETIDCDFVEQKAIKTIKPPLNFKHNTHPFRKPLKYLRVQFRKNASILGETPMRSKFIEVYNEFVDKCKKMGIN